MGKGWSLWRLGRPAEAALAFEKAYGLETNSELKVQALFKTADALFASGQYKAAADKYRRVSEEFRGGPLAAPALYQLAECFARLGERARAEQILAGLVEAQPDSAAGDQARLRMAQLKEEQNLWDEAAAEYERVIAACRQEAYCAQAVHARGLIRYRLGRFKEAEEDFVRVFTQYPTNALAEQAFYMRGWCLYLQGRDGEALDIGRQFLTRYPASAWAPEVLFWLGEYQYNRANFADAERQFGELVNQYPSGPLADKALYWAGRAAAAQKEFVRAIDYYTRLAKDYPQSSKLAEARFAQGDALSELGQFAGAILAFEEVIVRFPGSYLADLAWGRKGDCQFTLGKDEPGRYEEALAAYRMVLGSPTATADLKRQAEYKIGRCHEKRGRTADALESYLNVVYSFLAGRERGVPGNPLWFTRAAFNAAALQENAGRWREAVAIYRRVANANVPASDEAAERMRKIRFEHWIMF
jgi:TolA-binding protein